MLLVVGTILMWIGIVFTVGFAIICVAMIAAAPRYGRWDLKWGKIAIFFLSFITVAVTGYLLRGL